MPKHITRLFRLPYFYITIIILGIGLKFYGIESKFFWLDEVFTITHTSGVQWEEFVAAVPKDSLYSIEEFNGFLDLNNGEYSAMEQFKGLSQMVQLTPLHYFFLVPWHRIVGGHPVHYRLFSLFIFLLSLPLLYLLAFRVSKSKQTALLAVSLMSVAPFFHFYAQEARYFSLWAFSLILANLLLLKALDKNRNEWWLGYGLSVVFAMYVSALSPLLFAGHLLFVLCFQRDQMKGYFLATIGAVACYLPWMITMYRGRNAILSSTSWQMTQIDWWEILVGPWIGMANNFYTAASDTGAWSLLVNFQNGSTALYIALGIQLAIVFLIGWALYHLIKSAPKKETWFLLLNIIPIMLFFYAFDFAANRTTSLVYRYHIILGIAGILILSWFIDRMMNKTSRKFILIYIFIVSVSLINIINIGKNPCHHNIGFCKPHLIAANILSADKKPLLITDANYAFLLFQWDMTLACDSKNIDVLYRASGDKIYDYLDKNQYSNIYLHSASSESTFGLIRAYQRDSTGRFPKIYELDKFAAALVNVDTADRNDYLFDLSRSTNTHQISINIDSKEVLQGDTVFITGNHYTLGDFDPHHTPLKNLGDGHWQITIPVEIDFDLEYRFTLGSWDRQMMDSTGYTFSSFTMNVNRDTSVSHVIEGWENK
jgi:uncharacterized membrane protein